MGADNWKQKADESLSRTAAAAGVPSLPVLDHNVLSMPHAVEAYPLTFLIDKNSALISTSHTGPASRDTVF
jgi:hypothetical protein